MDKIWIKNLYSHKLLGSRLIQYLSSPQEFLVLGDDIMINSHALIALIWIVAFLVICIIALINLTDQEKIIRKRIEELDKLLERFKK